MKTILVRYILIRIGGGVAAASEEGTLMRIFIWYWHSDLFHLDGGATK